MGTQKSEAQLFSYAVNLAKASASQSSSAPGKNNDCRLRSRHSCKLLPFPFYLLTFCGCSLLVNVKCLDATPLPMKMPEGLLLPRTAAVHSMASQGRRRKVVQWLAIRVIPIVSPALSPAISLELGDTERATAFCLDLNADFWRCDRALGRAKSPFECRSSR
jgi:hypothetical protein